MTAVILYNGPIYTMNPEQPRVQALGIRDGRVVIAGSEGKVQAAFGGHATLYNLNGRAVIPALTDAHAHLNWYALGRRTARLDGIEQLDAVLQRIREAAANLPPKAWLQGGGWDHSFWGRWPTAADLDAIVSDRPVFLTRKDGHSAWVNSMALAIAGITDETADPPGGSIQRVQGKATGLLLETAIDLVANHIPEASQDERLSALRESISEAHSYGMAAVQVPPSLTPGDGALILTDFQRLRALGDLKLRILVHIGLDGLDDALRLGIRSGFGDNWLRLGGVKMFADGSLGSETAEMLHHYEGRRHLGSQTISTEELNLQVSKAIGGGISVIIHAIGDGANRRVLDAIELGLNQAGAAGPNPVPNRIEHAQVLHPRDIPRFADLGVVASMQPIHATADMELADELWGAERCATAYAWQSLKKSGAVLAFGSDAPVESFNPWTGIHAAVTRQRPDGTPKGGWYPEQCLSVADAIWAYTAGPAVAAGTSHELGSLAPGKLADLAVLSADPFKIDPSQLYTIAAEATMIEGQFVWEKTVPSAS